jgi:hypothetical protein
MINIYMYNFVMEHCNFKIIYEFKIFIVLHTANDFAVLPIGNSAMIWRQGAFVGEGRSSMVTDGNA